MVGLAVWDPGLQLLDVFQARRKKSIKTRPVNELGNEIMARRVADLIAEVWGWPRKRLQQPPQKARERTTTRGSIARICWRESHRKNVA